MKILNQLSSKYGFTYGIVNQFEIDNLEGYSNLSKYAILNVNPRSVLDECRSVIVFAFGYDKLKVEADGFICSYATYLDYHKRFLPILNEVSSHFSNSVIHIDSNLLNERYFAKKSGLGFIGKNSMLITKEFGSYCHLALLLVKEKLEATTPSKVSCGNCSLCIKNCPTNALEFGFDCSSCISEITQDKGYLGEFSKLNNHVYGCDECINVCVFNRKVKVSNDIMGIDLGSNLSITKNEFKKFKDSGFYWIGHRTFLRNIHLAYINVYNDYSMAYLLNETNSDYLKKVYQKIMEGKNE